MKEIRKEMKMTLDILAKFQQEEIKNPEVEKGLRAHLLSLHQKLQEIEKGG